jgi:voltage-gated potassium channel
VDIRYRLRVAGLLILGLFVVGASGFHFIEDWPWFDGVYMTLITMTTVGYAEVHPLTVAGRAFNVFVILAAVLIGGFLIATFTQAMLEFELSRVLGRRRMEREIAKLSGHYIICGAGRVGRTVAREFRARAIPLVIIEKERGPAQWAMDEGIPILIGSASQEDVLERARIRQAEGLVAAVTSDAENLYIVLTARGLCPSLKIIARASEDDATGKLLRAGATQVVSPYKFVGHRIVQLLLRPNVLDFIDTAFGTERLDMQIEEVLVPQGSPLANKTIADSEIRQKCGVLVLALKRADGTLNFNPAPDAAIRAGDHLIAIGSTEHLEKLETLVGS